MLMGKSSNTNRNFTNILFVLEHWIFNRKFYFFTCSSLLTLKKVITTTTYTAPVVQVAKEIEVKTISSSRSFIILRNSEAVPGHVGSTLTQKRFFFKIILHTMLEPFYFGNTFKNLFIASLIACTFTFKIYRYSHFRSITSPKNCECF